MKQITKSPTTKFSECATCGCLWRVMPDGRIDFAPRSPAMHHPCIYCMVDVVAASKKFSGKLKPKDKTSSKKSTKVEGE